MKTLTALYGERTVYVYYTNRELTYVLASYTDDGRGLFKINTPDLIIDIDTLKVFRSFIK